MERQAKDGTIYKQVGDDNWTVVSREAKDGTTYVKVGADEWKPLAQEKPKFGAVDTAWNKAMQGLSLNFGDELEGAERAIFQSAGESLGLREDDGLGFQEKYKQARDQRRADLDQASRERPILSGTAETAGALATFAIPGLNGAKLGQMVARGAAEGAAFGLGNSESDNALEMAGDTIKGGLMGAAGGAIAKGATTAVGKGINKFKKAAPIIQDSAETLSSKASSEASQAQATASSASGSSKVGAEISGGDLTVEQGGKLFEFKAPQSLDELNQWKPSADTGQVLGKARLKEIEKSVPDLKTKPLNYHYDMMENPKAMKALKLRFENLPTENAQKIAAYNQDIVNESAQKIKSTVDNLAGFEPRNLNDAGNDFIGSVKEKYNLERETLGPVFKQIQDQSEAMNQVASGELITELGKNTKLRGLLMIDPNSGRYSLKANAPRTGLADQEHAMLARVIEDLNDGMTFRELQSTREFLRKAVDPKNPGASAEINKTRTLLLRRLEEMAGEMGEGVSKTFKGWAVNERNLESVEKIIGGSIDSLDAMYAANPDKVVGKIFSNPNHTKVVRDYIGPEKIQELAASYIQTGIDKASDSAKGFSPEKFRGWLKTNRQFLEANVTPEINQRLNALADYGYYGKRFLDEVNPSGTAASLKEMLEPKTFSQKVAQKGVVGAIRGEVSNKVDSVLSQRSAVKTVNEMLAEKPLPKPKRDYSKIKDAVKRNIPKTQASGATLRSLTSGAERTGAAAQKDEEPSKGPKQWASKGYEKVVSADPEFSKSKDEMLKNPKLKEMLYAISDLKPGSKPFENQLMKIKNFKEKN